MQTIYIGNSLIDDELAIAQRLISDILTCLRLMYRAPLAAEAPHRGVLQHCNIDTSYSKDRATLPPLVEEAPHLAPKQMNLHSTALRLYTNNLR